MEPDPRPVRPVEHPPGLGEHRAVVGGRGQDGREDGPELLVRQPDHDHLTGRRGPQHRLHRRQRHRRAAGGHRAGPAQHDQAAADQPPAVPDRGEPVGVPAQRPGGAGVPVADEARPDPDLPVPDHHLHARERPQVLGVRAPGHERQLGGAVVVVHGRAGGHGPVVQAGGEPVAGDHDGHAGQRGPRQPGQVPGGEVGVRRVREVVDEPRPGDRRVHGREQVHRRGERSRHPDPGVRGQPGQPGDGVERGDPGVRRPHHGAGRPGGPGGAQADGFPRRVGGQEVRDLRQACAPRAGGGEHRAGPGRPRARRARPGPRPRP